MSLDLPVSPADGWEDSKSGVICMSTHHSESCGHYHKAVTKIVSQMQWESPLMLSWTSKDKNAAPDLAPLHSWAKILLTLLC